MDTRLNDTSAHACTQADTQSPRHIVLSLGRREGYGAAPTPDRRRGGRGHYYYHSIPTASLHVIGAYSITLAEGAARHLHLIVSEEGEDPLESLRHLDALAHAHVRES